MESNQKNIKRLHSSISFIFDVDEEDIRSKSRLRKITDARKAFVYFLSTHLKMGAGNIARKIRKDHSAIRWMFNEAESLMETDEIFNDRIERVKSAIGMTPRTCPCCGRVGEKTKKPK